MASVDQLPWDIVLEILARLPAETLVRLRSVSKSWQALIKSPSFINQHLNLSLSMISSSPSSTFLALVYPDYHSSSYASSMAVTIDKARRSTSIKQFYLPEEHCCNSKLSPLLGCGCGCCGVYCMCELFEDRAVIYNPATRETRMVPSCTANKSRKMYFKFVAFSCSMNQSTKVRDFKLMRFLYHTHGAPVLQVYTMSTNSWTSTPIEEIELRVVSETKLGHPNGVVNLHNKAHWLVKFMENNANAILCFDFDKEFFELLPVPVEFINSRLTRNFLTLFDNKFLCLVKRKKRRKIRHMGTEGIWRHKAV